MGGDGRGVTAGGYGWGATVGGDAGWGVDVAAISDVAGGVCAAQTKRAGGFPPALFLCILRSALCASDVCQINLEAWAH